MSNSMQLSGFAEADQLLKAIPSMLRERSLKKAIRKAVNEVSRRAAMAAPSPGKTTGGIEYTERKGKRANRPMLASNIGQVVRVYADDAVIVGVAGPVKSKVGRHAHLVEMGFHHTTKGTLAGSGRIKKRTRRAARAIQTGKGARGRFVFPRPFMLHTFTRLQPQLMATIIDDLKRTVTGLTK